MANISSINGNPIVVGKDVLTPTTVEILDATDSSPDIVKSIAECTIRDLMDFGSVQADKGFKLSSSNVENLSGYSCVTASVRSGSTLRLINASEAINSYGYGIYNISNTVIASGSEPLTSFNDGTFGVEITVPDNAAYIAFTVKTNDIGTVHMMESAPIVDKVNDLSNEFTESFKYALVSGAQRNIKAYATILRGYAYEVNRKILLPQTYGASLSAYSCVRCPVKAGTKLTFISSESFAAYGWCVRDKSGNVLVDGPQGTTQTVNVPRGGYEALFTINNNDIESYTLTETIPLLSAGESAVTSSHTVIIGDSWSDTNPEHTSYTKWPVYFEQWSGTVVHNYAQNGSSIEGADNYATNGTHGGQVAASIADLAYDHSLVNLVIIEGGVNDFRGGKAMATVANGLLSLIDRLKNEFTNARIVCILNNQIYVNRSQWDFMQGLKNYVKKERGVPCYTTFGWVPATNYTGDKVHPDDYGYAYFAANVMAACCGGAPTFVKNSATAQVGTGQSVVIEETFDNERLYRSISLTIDGAESAANVPVSIADSSGLLCNIPFTCRLVSIRDATSLSDIKDAAIIGTSPESSSESQHRATTFTFSVIFDAYDGTYDGTSIVS